MVTDTQVSVDGVLQPNWSLEETMLDGEHYVAVAMQHNSVNMPSLAQKGASKGGL